MEHYITSYLFRLINTVAPFYGMAIFLLVFGYGGLRLGWKRLKGKKRQIMQRVPYDAWNVHIFFHPRSASVCILLSPYTASSSAQ